VEATRQIVSDVEGVKVLALSMYSDPRFVTEMFRAGASGFVLKDSAFDELIRAINTVSKDCTYVSPAIAGDLIDRHVRPEKDEDNTTAYSILSDREREVLQMLAEGQTTKEIAAKLYRSVKTVETHRRNIMQKLDIHSLPELTKYAVRQGITALDR
jgi:DNA-binding NarL/FixJ family response regulator